MIRDTTNSWRSHPNLSKRFKQGRFGAQSERELNACTHNTRQETKGSKRGSGLEPMSSPSISTQGSFQGSQDNDRGKTVTGHGGEPA